MNKCWILLLFLVSCSNKSDEKKSLDLSSLKEVQEFYSNGTLSRELCYQKNQYFSMETNYFPSGQIERETFRYKEKLCQDEYTFYDSSNINLEWPIKKYIYYNCFGRGEHFVREYTKKGKIVEGSGSPIGFLLNQSYYKNDKIALVLGLGLATPPRMFEKLLVKVKLKNGEIIYSDESTIEDSPVFCDYWIETTLDKSQQDFLVEIIYSICEYSEEVSTSDTCVISPDILDKGMSQFVLCP